MFTWKLIWQVLVITLVTGLITAPAYWSDALSRKLVGNRFRKKEGGPQKPPER